METPRDTITVTGVYTIRGRGQVIVGRSEEASIQAGDALRVLTDPPVDARCAAVDTSRTSKPGKLPGREVSFMLDREVFGIIRGTLIEVWE